MIDSDENLSDGLEMLQEKFRQDQLKDEKALLNQVLGAAYAINKRTRDNFEEDQRYQKEYREKVDPFPLTL